MAIDLEPIGFDQISMFPSVQKIPRERYLMLSSVDRRRQLQRWSEL